MEQLYELHGEGRSIGKTHLAVALAIKAIEQGYGAYFIRA